MKIFAIADLHLCFGKPDKSMEIFGEEWKNYPQKIKFNWERKISHEDLVLLSGDISWGKTFDEAVEDLQWIDALPGKKIIIKGNHDYWWSSKAKLKEFNFPTLYFIQNDALHFEDFAVTGTRLWENKEFNFSDIIVYKENPSLKIKPKEENLDDEKIFSRECQRLILGLKQIIPSSTIKIVMTHYPPLSNDLQNSKVSKILEEYNIDICVFGHLHHVKKNRELFGEKNGVKYILTSADYLNFDPIRIY